jgi:hypothetical protein
MHARGTHLRHGLTRGADHGARNEIDILTLVGNHKAGIIWIKPSGITTDEI